MIEEVVSFLQWVVEYVWGFIFKRLKLKELISVGFIVTESMRERESSVLCFDNSSLHFREKAERKA